MRGTSILVGLWLFAGCAGADAGAVGDDVSSIDAAVVADIAADGDLLDAVNDEPDLLPEGDAGLLDTEEVEEADLWVAPEVEVVPEVDLTEAMFAPERLLDVVVTLAPEDWDALRNQTRTVFDLFGAGCMEGPFEAPFTYFEGTVSVDGEVVESVGVRKKGFLGSMSVERPSLKLKFGEYVDGQELQGLKRMTLNNSQQDPSRQRQCLAYELFRAAGVIAPRCNWAKVTVNGEYLGVYTHVDSLKKPFIRRNFPDPEGTMWEGTLSDFRDEWMPTFEQKLNEGSDDATRLWAVKEALETASDEALFDALNAHIDMEQFFTFWVMEVLTGHWDGYAGNTNNFYLYERPDDDDRLTFIPWGTDGTFVYREEEGKPPPPASVMTTGVITKRLYAAPATRLYYLARLQVLLEAHWDVDALMSRITARKDWLAPHIRPQDREWQTWNTWELQDYVQEVPWRVQQELDQGGVTWSQPLRSTFCMEYLGYVDASYETTWGTLHTTNAMEAGTGSFTGEFNGEPLGFADIGSSADEGQDQGQGQAVVGVFGANGAELHILVLQTAMELFSSGTTIPIDWQSGWASLLYMNQMVDQSPNNVGFIANGIWSLEEAGKTPGAPVRGAVYGDLYRWKE